MAIGTDQVVLTVVMALSLAGVYLWLARLTERRSHPASGGAGAARRESEATEKPGGLVRWLTTVDHRDIGLMYGAFGLFSFAWGGVAVVLMRLELVTPPAELLGPAFYNALMTTHGITMLFLFGTPILAAFSNYVIPLLIGADDMAFPRINAIAFWLLPPGRCSSGAG